MALGCMGLSYDDFCRLTPAEFGAVHKAFTERDLSLFQDRWNRTRTHAAIVIQPHIGKRHRITPEKLLPMPWDKEAGKRKPGKKEEPETAPRQREERMRRVLEKFGNK